MPAPGEQAPDFTLPDQAGNPVTLSERRGENVVLYFYPKADTPGCTKQGCSLRDGYEALTKQGVAVIGVSHDDVAAQKAFKEKYHLPFTLIADHDDKVINAFGVPTYPVVGFAHRQAYLIKDGKVIYADYEGTTDKQAETILKVLAAQ